jgi:hypothetical protein
MKGQTESSGSAAQATTEDQQYATRDEVEKGLRALTDVDYGKLIMIARYFCKQRRLSLSKMEPEELLSEAVLKTLQCEQGKRWANLVNFLRHARHIC